MDVTMEQARYDELAMFLREMVGRFGDTAFTDKRRLLSLLSDRLVDARREIKVVGAAIDERAFELLGRAHPEQLAMEIERIAAKLENDLGIRSDVAVPVVRACAYGLSIGPLPSTPADGGTAAGKGGGEAIGNDVSWVGLSEPVAAGAGSGQRTPPSASSSEVWKRRLLTCVGIGVLILSGANYIGSHGTTEQPVAAQPTQPAPQPRPSAPAPAVQPQPAPVVQPEPAPVVPQPAPAVQPQPQQPTAQPVYYADENYDFHVPPQSTLKSVVGDPTPLTVPGATTVSTVQLVEAMQNRTRMILIDALKDAHTTTIRTAIPLPYAGSYGTFNDETQARLSKVLGQLTQNHPEMPLVFFCEGIRCWESYNAVLRARAAGYLNVFWYRGGLTAWRAANLATQSYP